MILESDMEKILSAEERTILMLEAVRCEARAVLMALNLTIAVAFKEDVEEEFLAELRKRGTDSMKRSTDIAARVLGEEAEE